ARDGLGGWTRARGRADRDVGSRGAGRGERPMNTVVNVALAMLVFAASLCLVRLARGPSLADRVLALDTLLIVGVIGVGVEAARTRSGVYLDVLLVVALVAFIGTSAAARYIER